MGIACGHPNGLTGDHILRRAIIAGLLLLILCASEGMAQTRRRGTSRTPTRTTAAQRAAEVKRNGAAQVAAQIKNLTRFIYLLGGVAKGLEQTEEEMRRSTPSQTLIEQSKRNKATVRTSLQGVREGLDKLEIQFRTTRELQPYYIRLAGSAAGAVSAEELAAANQFERSGRALLDVVSRLTDVLVAMQ